MTSSPSDASTNLTLPGTDVWIDLTRVGDGVALAGSPAFGVYHDVARPGGDDGVFAEWSWNTETGALEFRACPFGLYPVYLYATPERICLATQLMRLVSRGTPLDPDYPAIAYFLRRGCYPGDDTPFLHIRRVPPAARGVWRPGKGLTLAGGPRKAARLNVERAEAMATFNQLLTAAVRKRAPRGRSVVPISGGRDSRHLLLDLAALGMGPDATVTMHHFPPRPDQDAEVGTLFAGSLGVAHTALPHDPSEVGMETRKNVRMDFSTDWGAWSGTMLDFMDGRFDCVYGGFGGDTLARGVRPNPQTRLLWQERNFDALVAATAERWHALELGLQTLLEPWAYERLHPDLARQRLRRELEVHAAQPNPELSFTLYNALRRRTGPQWLRMTSDVIHVFLPYMDLDVHDFLAGLPIEMALDAEFHSEAIRTRFPEHSRIPFGDSPAPFRDAPAFFSRYARELSELALASHAPSHVNRLRLAERLAGVRATGDGRLLKWHEPRRTQCLLELESATRAAANGTQRL